MSPKPRPTRPPLSAMPGLAIVVLVTLSAATARAQLPKAVPMPGTETETARVYALPRQAVEAMRREMDAIRKRRNAVDAINRAVPVFVAPAQAVVRQVEIGNEARRAIPFPEPVVVEVGANFRPAVIQQGVGANFKPAMIQQWTPQIRPILRVEYQFLRTVCNPSRGQRMPIARAGLDALEDAATKYVDWQVNPRRVVQADANGVLTVQRGPGPDVRKLIQDALAAAVKENLAPEQIERYRKEVEARSEDQKRAGVLGLVTKLDQSLLLDTEQREKITRLLLSRWDDSWFPAPNPASEDQSQYLPLLPDASIVPFLDESQKKTWAGIQKVSSSSVTGVADVNGNVVEGPLDDEFPDEATREGPKPGAKQ